MNCIICQSPVKVIKEDTYQCSTCSHIYRDYRGDSIQFHKEIYRDKDKSRWKRDSNEINEDGSIHQKFHDAREKIVVGRREAIASYLGPSYSLFDIGSGAGTFAQELAPHVGEIECLELSENLIEECRRLGYHTYTTDFLQHRPTREYDLVSVFHVLEHVQDVATFIEKCHAITKKYLIIEVPTLTCYYGKSGKTRNAPPPNNGKYDGHYHYFSIPSLLHLMKDRFKTVKIASGIQKPAILYVGEKK